jgi:hypothetical protein
MLKATFQLKLRDGRSVTAEVETESPDIETAVHYSGAVDALPRRFDMADVPTLRLLFVNRARELGGEREEKIDGEYERWAE